MRVLRMDVIDRVRPVQLASLALDARIWGRNPFGYHLTSLLLHALNTALLTVLLLRMIPPDTLLRRPIAGVCALLFAAHPALAEAVTEVSYREDLLATTGILGGLLVMARAASRFGWRRYAGAASAVALLMLAAGAKETGWTGPVLLAASCPVLAKKTDGRLYGGGSLGATLMILSFIVYSRHVAPPHSAIFFAVPSYPDPSVQGMLRLLPRLWLFQLQQLFLPYSLAADYGPFSIRHLPFAGATAVILVVALGAGMAAWLVKPLRFGLFFFGFSMLPTSSLLPLFQPLADRYLYLPMAGLSFTAAALLGALPTRPKQAVTAFLALLMALWIPLCIQRQRVWSDPIRLWTDTLQKNPWSLAASNNLGYAQMDRGNNEAALRAWEKTLSINPEHANAWAGAALAFEALGDSFRANAALARAVEIDPLYSNPAALRAALAMSPEQIERLKPLLKRNGFIP